MHVVESCQVSWDTNVVALLLQHACSDVLFLPDEYVWLGSLVSRVVKSLFESVNRILFAVAHQFSCGNYGQFCHNSANPETRFCDVHFL